MISISTVLKQIMPEVEQISYRDAVLAARNLKWDWVPCSKTIGKTTTVCAWHPDLWNDDLFDASWAGNRYWFRCIRWYDGYVVKRDWVEGHWKEFARELNTEHQPCS